MTAFTAPDRPITEVQPRVKIPAEAIQLLHRAGVVTALPAGVPPILPPPVHQAITALQDHPVDIVAEAAAEEAVAEAAVAVAAAVRRVIQAEDNLIQFIHL